MNNHITSLVVRATVAITKQATMPAESEAYPPSHTGRGGHPGPPVCLR